MKKNSLHEVQMIIIIIIVLYYRLAEHIDRYMAVVQYIVITLHTYLLVDTCGYLWMASGINPKVAMGGRLWHQTLGLTLPTLKLAGHWQTEPCRIGC